MTAVFIFTKHHLHTLRRFRHLLQYPLLFLILLLLLRLHLPFSVITPQQSIPLQRIERRPPRDRVPRRIDQAFNVTRRPLPFPKPETHWHVPAILAAHALPLENDMVQLTIFTQGAESKRHGFHLLAKNCVVGGRRYKIMKRLINVFVCHVQEEEMVKGDLVSIEVGRGIYERERWGGEGIWRREGRLIVQSGVTWGREVRVEGMEKDGMPVWEVCAMYQDKESTVSDLEEWIQYHRRIGVDQVYVYDNNVKTDILERHFEGRKDVEVVYWPWRKSQEIAQNHFLVLAKSRCKWVLMCDVDEFLMVKGGSLKGVLRMVEKDKRWGGISLPTLTMLSSGFVTRPKGKATPEIFRHRMYIGDWHRRKPIALVNDIVPRSLVHYLPLREGKRMYQMKSHPESRVNERNYIFVVHYTKKSWEEYFKKTQIGRAALEVYDWDWGKGLDFMHEKFKTRRKKHVDMWNQVKYTEFLKEWKRVMKLSVIPQRVVYAPTDSCPTCWSSENVWYDKRWWEPFI